MTEQFNVFVSITIVVDSMACGFNLSSFRSDTRAAV